MGISPTTVTITYVNLYDTRGLVMDCFQTVSHLKGSLCCQLLLFFIWLSSFQEAVALQTVYEQSHVSSIPDLAKPPTSGLFGPIQKSVSPYPPCYEVLVPLSETILINVHHQSHMEFQDQRNNHQPNSANHGVVHHHARVEANSSANDLHWPHHAHISTQQDFSLLCSRRWW